MTTQPKILIVDDEPDIRELLEITLGRLKVDTLSVATLEQAHKALLKETFALCLTDMRLPDGDGLDFISFTQEYYPHMPIVMITAHGSMDTAIIALKAGAYDYLTKPIDLNRLRDIIKSALNLSSPGTTPQIPINQQFLGEAANVKNLRAQVNKVARSQAPVYINGESGTGKEVIARLIHLQGPRAKQPFIAINCGAIPSELMESEFFGHRKGSFTGATHDKQGLFQAANGGTLFLDEVADLCLAMQVKLLRAIQEKSIRAVGDQQEQPIDVRILSATHADLAARVSEGKFRQDLYYRLNVIELKIPALRAHKEDIPLLAHALLAKSGYQATLSQEAIQALCQYDFPGNVRELENILERASTLCEGGVIRPEDLHFIKAATPQGTPPQTTAFIQPHAEPVSTDRVPFDVSSYKPDENDGLPNLSSITNLEEYLERVERKLLIQALEETRWNRTAAAERLGLSFRSMRYRLKKLDIN